MPPPPSARSVFVHYAHESEEHRARVLDLAWRLRRDGVDAVLDRFMPPEADHAAWTREQVAAAEVVVGVASTWHSPPDCGEKLVRVGFSEEDSAALLLERDYDRLLARLGGAAPAGLELAWIPGGTFWMGSPEGENDDDEHPRHPVTLSRGFWLGVTPVTQAVWRELAERAGLDPDPSHFKGPRRPVESVTWLEAVRWCNALSEATGRAPVYRVEGEQVTWDREALGFRLPTEAEWERACRAGTETSWSCSEGELAEHAWFGEDSGGSTHPVGEKKPNPWGLRDLYGNVWEWCWDWYGRYAADPAADPAGASSGDFRVMRGGAYWNSAAGCRSAVRFVGDPGFRDWFWGFRVVLPSSPPPVR